MTRAFVISEAGDLSFPLRTVAGAAATKNLLHNKISVLLTRVTTTDVDIDIRDLEAEIKQAIIYTAGVRQVLEVSTSLDSQSRHLTISFAVIADDGTLIQGTDADFTGAIIEHNESVSIAYFWLWEAVDLFVSSNKLERSFNGIAE